MESFGVFFYLENILSYDASKMRFIKTYVDFAFVSLNVFERKILNFSRE